MKATTIVCSSFVIQIKSRHNRATMKTPLKASGTFEEPWRGHGKPEARAHGRAVHSDSASRFRLASPRPFLFDSTNVCPSPSSSSFLFSSSFSFSPPPRRTDRTMEPAMYVMHGRGWLIIPGARPKARNPKHFRRTRAWNFEQLFVSVSSDARLSGNFVECAIRKLEMSVIWNFPAVSYFFFCANDEWFLRANNRNNNFVQIGKNIIWNFLIVIFE